MSRVYTMSYEEYEDVLKKRDKYDILTNNEALYALQGILDRKNTAEVFAGKYGIVVREIKRKTIYSVTD